MQKTRFLDDWTEKVDEWAEENVAMIARYDALQNYRKMRELAENLTPCEMHFFSTGGEVYSIHSPWPHEENKNSEEEPEEDIFWED